MVVVVLIAAAGACTPGGTEPEVVDQSGVYAAAIQHVLVQTELGGKDLIFVAGPSLEVWDQWCSFETGEPEVEDEGGDLAPCDVLDASSFDLPIIYEPGSSEADEIETALSHAQVDFIEDPDSVIEPFEQGVMIAPIQNNAGLITFALPIQANGKIYIAIDAHSSGFLLELTPSETPSDTGWDVTPIASWIV